MSEAQTIEHREATREIAEHSPQRPLNVAALSPTGPATVVHYQADPPKSDAQSLMEVISRAASDPSVDIDKLERLMVMRKDILAQEAEQRFNEAMTAAQTEMRPISADATNPQTRSKYATYAKLDAALRPIYTKHGFSVSFDEGDTPKPEHIRVLAYVAHDAGHTRTYRKDMPADGKGAKGGDVMTKTHAAGAAGSYGARYLLKGIFNVAVGEDDRDGNMPNDAGDNDMITDAQIDELKALIEETDSDIRKFCAFLGVDGLAMVRDKDFARAKSALNSKKRAAQK